LHRFLKRINYEAAKAIEELEEIKPRIRKNELPFARCRFSSQRYWEERSRVLCEWIAAMIDAVHLPIV
jgi:hypothetical protein